MTEFALALPVLVLLITSVLDLGHMLNSYMVLTEAAHNGARLASGLPIANAGEAGCFDPPAAGPAVVDAQDLVYHQQVRGRVQNILSNHDTGGSMTALCIGSGVEAGAPADRDVYIQVSARYDSFFPLFELLPVRIRVQAPFLQG